MQKKGPDPECSGIRLFVFYVLRFSLFSFSTDSATACTDLDRHADVLGLFLRELRQLHAEISRCSRATSSSRCFGST